ncbi:MAG: twin-arginine translocase TatA/TatE family subunit [Promethearchaeota archaeon]|jgi:sec-independent protein translocase protein TatA
MMGLQTPELIIIMFIILLFFGGNKLPELARSIGSAVKEYSEAAKEPMKYMESKTTSDENENRVIIIETASKMGIETEGRDIKDIAKDILNATEKKEARDL